MNTHDHLSPGWSARFDAVSQVTVLRFLLKLAGAISFALAAGRHLETLAELLLVVALASLMGAAWADEGWGGPSLNRWDEAIGLWGVAFLVCALL